MESSKANWETVPKMQEKWIRSTVVHPTPAQQVSKSNQISKIQIEPKRKVISFKQKKKIPTQVIHTSILKKSNHMWMKGKLPFKEHAIKKGYVTTNPSF